MYERILVPVELVNEGTLSKALNLTAQTAKGHSAEVIFVDVVDSAPTSTAHSEIEERSEHLTSFAVEQASRYRIITSGEITLRSDLHLNLGKDITAVACEVDCDLRVMASHLPGFKEHFLSSNSGYVAAHASVSVFVVR